MPWKVQPMSEVRFAFVYQVETLHRPVAEVCREFGVARKTGYKWLSRSREEAGSEALQDRSRRPRSTPRRTAEELENQVLAVRDQYGWGARKIRALLQRQGVELPSINTVHAVLRRHGRLRPAPQPSPPLQTFERSAPNELWQLDFKGPLEVARQRVCPLSILDDHSRFLLTVRADRDLTMNTAWRILWDTFGEHGLPEGVLCDNAFSNLGQNDVGLSRFDSWLVRLNVRPVHGRAYHPQTQGKVERLHRTYQDEMLRHVRRDSVEHFNADADRWRREIYNTLRPHEALADLPPIARWRPSPRPRPDKLPEVEYPSGSTLRKVSCRGEIFYHNYRILVGKGLAGETVRLEEQAEGWAVYFSHRQVRLLAPENLRRDTVL
jgi:transposase InsO family protein